MYSVTRQLQWPGGNRVVEISEGGIDCANPDALVKVYSGELEEYSTLRQALKAAIRIAKNWKLDSPDKEIFIGRGAPGGMSIPLTQESLTERTFGGFREWTNQRLKEPPKCYWCAKPLSEVEVDEIWQDSGFLIGNEEFCSPRCTEKASIDVLEETDRMEEWIDSQKMEMMLSTACAEIWLI